MKVFSLLFVAAALLIASGAPSSASAQDIKIQGRTFYRKGSPWLAKGIDVEAFSHAPRRRAGDKNAMLKMSYWAAPELNAMRDIFHANTIRMQISQADLDPQSSTYDPTYVSDILTGVRLAERYGFAVVLVIDAQQDNVPSLSCMPSDSTMRAWKTLGPAVVHDDNVMLEPFNEPCKPLSDETKQEWAQSMQALIDILRGIGSTNILLLDGLKDARTTNGLFPLVHDVIPNRLALAIHPYLGSDFSTREAWNSKFGASIRQYPAIATEWNATPRNGCAGKQTPAVALSLLRYLEDAHIGLIGWAIDWPDPKLVKDHTNFEPTDFSSFTDCKDDSISGAGKLLARYPND
ncbi:Cellulase (glycosyl hydrolase family 5) [Enhydrobacter aerosaccus]|uniref:Cellulase (Glycosyl hydrolase family 5) n=1 Tax=Enhydrobacter aerosaccus TaxID=225324 RepID=A0A1T4TE17_9HYPH|nr:cellulase family glycosylhydrolase [Enhydrobacter aerosaccus]SKA38687.1 Cellulase (glycosyl hydrolase family 5) [Enhydrobacter aerosaccus]